MTPVATLSAAKQFERGFELCYCNGALAADGGSNATIPAVVCLAFAAELYLKSLLEFAGRKASGHDLLQLFRSLPEVDAIDVVRRTGLEEDRVIASLEDTGHAFVRWRYIHETQGFHSISLQFLQLLCNACRNVARAREDALRARLREA